MKDILTNEANTIIIYTIPLAPNAASLDVNKWNNPIINVVKIININNSMLPYFSSNNGPINKIYEKFPAKCAHPECPNGYVNNLTYVIIFIGEPLLNLKKASLLAPWVILSIIIAISAIKKNNKITIEFIEKYSR